ncbi:MAG: lipopolysaccharide biosynthesis protein [Slackia piriformis]|uniref:Lipopolysaccharide biosynthesis protein n=1 Tax=Slackia piriformis TaxID=626934 RepID=A0A943UZD3_9ACTN|nr:lipopolysaccharide biosynthesis protein [Slackia piriformis]
MTLLELLQLVHKHLKLVIFLPLACAIVAAVASFGFMPDTYTATTSMYVLTKAENAQGSVSNSDLSASQMLTNDVASLIKSDRVLKDTAASLNMESLSGYDITVESETTTRVLSVSVEGKDAQSTAIIANGLAKNVSSVAQEVMNIQSVNVIDEAATPEHPSGPKRVVYVFAALLGGLFAAVAFVVLRDMVNTRVRGADDVEELLGVPVIGRIPTMKGGE